ncbi:MAG: N-acetylglucosamine-6-phosphate deacetylase [Gemmataceae bacterium]
MRIRGRHYRSGEQVELTCADGVVTSVGPPTLEPVEAEAGWIAPGFCDLQVNGYRGISFNSLGNADELRVIVDACAAHGVSAFLPTLITDAQESLIHAVRTLADLLAADARTATRVPGFHVEGPAISSEDGPRGAHPRAHVRPPDWEQFLRLQEAAQGRIRLVTLAPELPGAILFIERLVAAGVLVAVGHTNAGPEQIHAAVAAGARLSTHLANGCSDMLPRHHNVVWEQAAEDRLHASLIADGRHLPPAVLKSLIRIKTPERCMLVSDLSPLAGLPPGRYPAMGGEFEVADDGAVRIPGTSRFAGSSAFLDLCVSHAAHCGGIALAEAIDMASARPREMLGLPRSAVEVGGVMDFVLFDFDDGRIQVQKIITA